MSCVDVTDIVSQQHVAPSQLQVNTKRIQALTQQIRNANEIDNLKLSLGLTGHEIGDLSKDLAAEAASLVGKFGAIVSPPSPNPISIVKWVGKFISANVSPQVMAFIKLMAQAIAFANAVEQLLSAIDSAAGRLEAESIALVNQELTSFSGSIHKAVYDAEKLINTNIQNAFCSSLQGVGLTPSDATDILRSYKSIQQISGNTSTNLASINSTVNGSLGTASTAVAAISQVANVQSTINLSSIDSLTTSVNNGSVDTFSSSVAAVANEPAPVNLSPPIITGTYQVGQTASVSNGVWSNNATSFSYQWQNNSADISGATSSTYTFQPSDRLATIVCEVMGSSQLSTTTQLTSSTPAILYLPINLSLPVISGSATVGSTLTATPGAWDGPTPTVAPSYQWLSNNINIAGATASTYTLTTSERTTQVSVAVTITNADGSTTVNSIQTVVVT